MKSHEKSALFMHFHPTERSFVRRCFDWIEQANRHQWVCTPFLDPRERQIIDSLIGRETAIMTDEFGGIPDAERSRLVVRQSYLDAYTEISPPISVLRICPLVASRMEHSHVLGSILGLGIRRDQLGDLFSHSQGCDVVVADEMVSFICSHLQHVGKDAVRVGEIQPEEIIIEEPVVKSKRVVVSSNRLDALIAEGFRLSRAKAVKCIQTGKCKLDWKIVERPSQMVEEGSLLSLRGYGRLSVGRIERKTKKGKYLVRLDVLL